MEVEGFQKDEERPSIQNQTGTPISEEQALKASIKERRRKSELKRSTHMNKVYASEQSLHSTEDFERLIPEKLFSLPKGLLGKIYKIIFFPTIALLHGVMPNIKTKPDLRKVLLSSIMIIIFSMFFCYGIYKLEAELIMAYNLKIHIVGLINGVLLGASFFFYSLSDETAEANLFITCQEFTIYKFSFLFGIACLILYLRGSGIEVHNPFMLLVGLGVIMFFQVIALLYSFCTKFNWRWQIGLLFVMLYPLIIAIDILF